MLRFINSKTFEIIYFSSWQEVINLGGINKSFLNKNIDPKDFYKERALRESIRLHCSNNHLSEDELKLRISLIDKL